ncbi:MAG TPA: hypothetical protein VF783_13895 [Terriglobales bacterium]
MGQHANARAWREYVAKQDREQEEYFEPSEPLTEFEKASQWDDERWSRIDAEVRYFGGMR